LYREDNDTTLYIFEIYPSSENSELAKIGQLILHQPYQDLSFFFHGNKVIVHSRSKRTLIVWDFIASAVASWFIDGPRNFGDKIIGVTETNIIMSRDPDYRLVLWIFQIPPLIKKTPSFDSEELDFPKLSPVLTLAYPGLTELSQTPDQWYYGDLSSLPLYFDMFENCETDAYTHCKLDITSDLSNISFTPIVKRSLPRSPYDDTKYRICEGRPVNLFHGDKSFLVGAYTGSGPTLGFGLCSDCHDSSRTPFSMPIPLTLPLHFFSFCPVSGRLVHTIATESDGNIVIRDFL